MRFAAACALVLVFGATAASTGDAAGGLHVVAKHLNNPRKIFVGPGGALYVVEAGTGGRAGCFGAGANRTCEGLTGAIVRIEHGTATPVVTGLWSAAQPNGVRGQGPAAVLVRGETYDVLMQDSTIDAQGRNALGPDGRMAGDLIATRGGKAAPKVLANFAVFEAKHDPDHGAGPGPKFGNPAIDSDPYALAAYRGGFAVADAAANDLLWVSPKGAISVLAVFPTRTVPLTPALAKRIGAPAGTKAISAQSVPSSVTVGPDGALYVGELTGVPFERGSARVWRVVPGRQPSVYASGFTNISDLAFDGKNLLVLELSSEGLTHEYAPGALIRVANGKRTVLASKGLLYPTGLAVGNGSIYISNDGLYPGKGTGPQGELVSLPASAGR